MNKRNTSARNRHTEIGDFTEYWNATRVQSTSTRYLFLSLPPSPSQCSLGCPSLAALWRSKRRFDRDHMALMVTIKTTKLEEPSRRKSGSTSSTSMIFITFEFSFTELMINAIEQMDQANKQTNECERECESKHNLASPHCIHLNLYTGHLHHLFYLYVHRNRENLLIFPHASNSFCIHWFAMVTLE